MPLFWIFAILPLVEIFVMIEVGSVIGAGWTILLILLTAMVGMAIVRRQGMAALADLQAGMADLRDPARPIAHGVLIMLAGALLIVPGFVTDALGALLLVPPLRDLLMRRMGRRVVVVETGWQARRPGSGPGSGAGGRVIETDYEVVQDHQPPDRGPRPPSGWTRD